MEKSTTLGMTLGLFAVGYGMYLKGADPHALINPAAFLIIFAGTFAALLNAFPMKDIKRFGKLLKIIFTGKKITSKQEILELFVSLAKSAKSEGVMGIEKKANEVEDPFIRSTLILVADGFPPILLPKRSNQKSSRWKNVIVPAPPFSHREVCMHRRWAFSVPLSA